MDAQHRSKRRLLAELKAIRARYPSMRMVDGSVPTFEGTIQVDGREHHVRVSLPPGYPSVPPEIREVQGAGGAVILSSGFHRFPDGTICLFPHGNDPQAWHQERRAVEALDRFAEFAVVERARAEGRHGSLFRNEWRVFVPTGFAAPLLLPGGRGRVRVRWNQASDRFADMLDFEQGIPGVPAGLGERWEAALPQTTWIPWLGVGTDESGGWECVASRQDLDELLRRDLPEAVFERMRREESVILAREVAGQPSRTEAVLFRRPAGDVRVLHRAEVMFAGPQERLFHRVDGALSGRAKLADVRVVLVGLGSLGGALALALARAGLRRFVLIDPDVLSVDNVCRHVGTTREIGWPKVEVVQAMIEAINPEAEVEAIQRWLAWDLPHLGAGAELGRLLAEDVRTVVVSTCAAHVAERQLNALAVRHGVTVIYASALGAGQHGRVFRAIPGKTPCYACVLAAQDAEPAKFPRFVADEGLADHAPYLHPELPGLGVDIQQIAMITARFTLQTIGRITGVDLGCGDESGDHLLWTNRGGWLFDRPLQIMVERIPRSPDCATCGAVREAEELTPDEEAELERLRAPR